MDTNRWAVIKSISPPLHAKRNFWLPWPDVEFRNSSRLFDAAGFPSRNRRPAHPRPTALPRAASRRCRACRGSLRPLSGTRTSISPRSFSTVRATWRAAQRPSLPTLPPGSPRWSWPSAVSIESRVRDLDDQVADLSVVGRGPEVLANALGQVRLRFAAGEDAPRGIRTHNHNCRVLLMQVVTDPADRAACPHPGHEVRDPAVRPIPDFRPGRGVMRLGMAASCTGPAPGARDLACPPVADGSSCARRPAGRRRGRSRPPPRTPAAAPASLPTACRPSRRCTDTPLRRPPWPARRRCCHWSARRSRRQVSGGRRARRPRSWAGRSDP